MPALCQAQVGRCVRGGLQRHTQTSPAAARRRPFRSQGFEIGSGFSGSRMVGSEHNDEFYMAENGEIRTRTNRWVLRRGGR